MECEVGVRLGGRKSTAVKEGEVVSRSAGSGDGHEVWLRACGRGMKQVAKKQLKRTAGGGGVPHRWVRRREVHGSDYKEASGGVGECEGEGGGGVMDAGELRCGHGDESTYISIRCLHENEQRLHTLFALCRVRER